MPAAGESAPYNPASMDGNMFAAAYLPAILVPVMTLVMPVLGMGLFTVLTQKDEI